MRLLISCTSSMAWWPHEPAVSIATGKIIIIIIIIIIARIDSHSISLFIPNFWHNFGIIQGFKNNNSGGFV